MPSYILEIIAKGVDNASPMLKGLGGVLGGFGALAGGAALAGVAALGVGLVDSVAKAMTFEQQLSGIQAVLQPTATEMHGLKQLSLDLGASTKFSAQEAAEGIEMLAKNGLNASQIMGGAASASLSLAAATGADLATAADIGTDALLQFGLTADQMGQAVNGIAGVTVASKFGIDDYSLALAQAGGVASAVGVEFDDFNTAIAGISPLFASGSDAGTSYKVMLQRLVPASDEAADTMMALGLIAEDGTNKFFDANGQLKDQAEIAGLLQEALAPLSEEQKNQALATMFGTDAMRAAVGMAKLGEQGFKDLKGQIGKVDAEEQAATRMNNLAGRMEQLKGGVETAQIMIGEQFIPVLIEIVDAVLPIVEEYGPKLAAWIGEWLPDAIRGGKVVLDWLANDIFPNAAIGAAYLGQKIGDVIDWFQGLKDAWDNLTLPGWLQALVGGGGGTTTVPGFAGGVENFTGGLAVVGEQGPELVNLPPGSDVLPADATRAILRGGGGSLATGGSTTVIHLTVQGSVIAERDLIESIRASLYRTNQRNAYSPGF